MRCSYGSPGHGVEHKVIKLHVGFVLARFQNLVDKTREIKLTMANDASWKEERKWME